MLVLFNGRGGQGRVRGQWNGGHKEVGHIGFFLRAIFSPHKGVHRVFGGDLRGIFSIANSTNSIQETQPEEILCCAFNIHSFYGDSRLFSPNLWLQICLVSNHNEHVAFPVNTLK